MKNRCFLFIATTLITLLIISCNTFDDKSYVSKVFEKVFNDNKSDFIFIKNFMFNNSDSINTIRMDNDTLCKISNSNIKDAFGNYILISVDDSMCIKSYKTKESLYKIKQFMIEQDISYISINNEIILISFKYNKTPCYNLYWENKAKKTETGVVINYNDNDREFWKYYLDSNWYLKGTPCFN